MSCPPDASLLFTFFAERLGERVGREPGRLGSWRALDRAIRISSLQGVQVVLAVDDCDASGATPRHELGSLVHLGSSVGADLTLIQLARADSHRESGSSGSAWDLAIGLRALTRSQVQRFLAAKLEAAGCTEPVFTPRSITRLHGLSMGVPRGLQQLASLSLMAGSLRGLEVIPPDLVDGVAVECCGEVRGLAGA